MNARRLLERANELAGGLVSRGHHMAGWPWGDLASVPQDVIYFVEGRITNKVYYWTRAKSSERSRP